jgi:hypothetical protein
VSVDPERIVAIDGFDDAVSRFFGLLYERTEHSIPDDQHAGIILIQVRIIDAVMYAMM